MTNKVSLAILLAFCAIYAALGQESSTPTPEQTPSPSPARNVRLSFVPPPMEGTISLGIFDASRKLVRVLHREAKIDSFTIDADSLNTTWDGKNDAGEDLPRGKYRARGYLVAQLKVEDIGKGATSIPSGTLDHVAIKLMTNPLVADTRSVVDLGVGFDPHGSFLKTMDGLPLATISETAKVIRVLVAKNGEKSVDVWQDDGLVVEQFRVSNIDKMMAFDCGEFELK